MEVVMEAMRMAGLALGLQALSSVALGDRRPCKRCPQRHQATAGLRVLSSMALGDPRNSLGHGTHLEQWPASRSACKRCPQRHQATAGPQALSSVALGDPRNSLIDTEPILSNGRPRARPASAVLKGL